MQLIFIAPLTSLRFFAAAAVMFFHLQGAFGYQAGNINFAAAITFFFVLSGFVLTHVYGDFPNRGKILDYYISRFARIWPLHVATALYFLWFIHLPSWDIVLVNLLLVQSWSMNVATAMSMNGVSWSISAEVFFYLLFPALIVTHRWWPLWLLGSVAVVVFGIAMAIFAGDVEKPITEATWLSFLHVGPPARFLEFLAGVLTALFFRRNRDIQFSAWIWTALELLVLLLVALVCQFDPIISLARAHLPSALVHWLIYSGTFPIMCLVVLCFAYSGGLISRALSAKPLIFLGDISFAIYMVHQLVLVTWIYRGWVPNAWDPAALCLILAQITCASIVGFLVVESPAKAAMVSAFTPAKRASWKLRSREKTG